MKSTDTLPIAEAAPLPVGLHAVVRRLRGHIAQMAPHQRERRGGQLIIEATDELERLQNVLQRIATEFPNDSPDFPNTTARHKCEQARLALTYSPNDQAEASATCDAQ